MLLLWLMLLSHSDVSDSFMETLDQRKHCTVQLCTEAPKNHTLEDVGAFLWCVWCMWRLCSQCDLVRFYGGINDANSIFSSKCYSIFYDYTKVHNLLCDGLRTVLTRA